MELGRESAKCENTQERTVISKAVINVNAHQLLGEPHAVEWRAFERNRVLAAEEHSPYTVGAVLPSVHFIRVSTVLVMIVGGVGGTWTEGEGWLGGC